MLSASEVKELKKRYGKLVAVTLSGEDCVFRRLTIGEFRSITSNSKGRWSVADAEDAIIELTLIHPKVLDLDALPAGLVTKLAEQILDASGFDDDIDSLNAVLEDKRRETESFQSMMIAFILAAMPQYKIEDLEAKTFDELLSMLTMAEAVFRIHKDLYNPNIAEIKLNIKSTLDDEEEEYKPEADPILQKLLQALPSKPAGTSMKLPRGTPPNEVVVEYE